MGHAEFWTRDVHVTKNQSAKAAQAAGYVRQQQTFGWTITITLAEIY